MKKKQYGILLILMIGLLMLPCIHALGDGYEFFCGPLKAGEKMVLYSAPQKGAKTGIHLSEQAEITGWASGYYRILWDNQVYFADSRKVEISAYPSEKQNALTVESDTALLSTVFHARNQKRLQMEGTILSDAEGFFAVIQNAYSGNVEGFTFIPFSDGMVNLEKVNIPVAALSPGRKQLTLQTIGECENPFRIELGFYVLGRVAEPDGITEQCVFSDRLKKALSTLAITTGWVPSSDIPSVTVTFPAEANVHMVLLQWFSLPSAYQIIAYDGSGNELQTTEKTDVFYLENYYPPNGTKSISISRPLSDKAKLCTVQVFEDDYPGETVQAWKDVPDHVDILFFATHQDDEVLFFGGAIPYYSESKEVAVAYMADCGRLRYQEALNGLWTMGVRNKPFFLGFEDRLTSSVETARNLWGAEESQLAVVRTIRRCRPDVLVAQDENGEYGHYQHILLTELLKKGLELAADCTYDPESVSLWGTWQVKKMYIHLYPEHQITMDWENLFVESKGLSSQCLAEAGYDKHYSQHEYCQMDKQGVIYDNRLFGLCFSAVGPDVLKNDFFENIP